ADEVKKAEHAQGGKPHVDKDKITIDEIANALAAPPNLPQESLDVASSFLNQSLPQLLADDDRLGTRLGFGESMSNSTSIDRALPILLVRRNDILKVMTKLATPFEIVNNSNNWRKDDAGRLVPNRIVFSLKTDNNASIIDPYSWSSVTLEQFQEGSWRIIQAGAPKLSRAMRQYEDPGVNHFLVWVPDLNRHYLGQIITAGEARERKIILTTLFDDRFVRVPDAQGEHIRKAGEKFDVTSEEFIFHLQRLYKNLEFPTKHVEGPIPSPSSKQYSPPK
ncbi:MAG TPA: hypothetical protein VK901_01665, partial [Nitrospiraceae bacterium]|nr:hypothetical protein [Nitrospiraceae bacterium]